MEHETLSRDRVLDIFSTVRKRVSRGSYTGTGKRLPSSKPPVQTPKEMALAGGVDPSALPGGHGQSFGQNFSTGNEPPAIGGAGPPAGTRGPVSRGDPPYV